ncbi:MAG TPA: hypothetical protein H9867_08530 [Candidatus Corynebacterium gallistercoris]|uniref:Uncharacterized protein n=1 Tax=Candidatus Corynebacterium gallistercoris TaxID=2838530 RepID=A0A9D1RZJ3_9CORY|nr:hypothetical protein [Candidatus Corynebacterium gallistercoris]
MSEPPAIAPALSVATNATRTALTGFSASAPPAATPATSPRTSNNSAGQLASNPRRTIASNASGPTTTTDVPATGCRAMASPTAVTPSTHPPGCGTGTIPDTSSHGAAAAHASGISAGTVTTPTAPAACATIAASPPMTRRYSRP